MKSVYKDKKASSHWSAAKNKERFSFRWLTAGQPLILFLRRFTVDFACSWRWTTFLRFVEGYRLLFPERKVSLTPNLTRPRLAASPGASIRPTRGISGFWVRQIQFTWNFACSCFRGDAQATFLRSLREYTGLVFSGRKGLLAINLSNPKPGYTTRGARRSGRAGLHKIGYQRKFSPEKQRVTVSSKESKKSRFNVSLESQTSEIQFKTEEGIKSPVHPWFISALCYWLPTSETTYFCLCKPLSCK